MGDQLSHSDQSSGNKPSVYPLASVKSPVWHNQNLAPSTVVLDVDLSSFTYQVIV